MLPDVFATLDGKAVEVQDARWTATRGGYDAASCLIPEADARRVAQGSVLRLFAQGTVIYEGQMAANPLVKQGTARIQTNGYKSRGEKASGRLLYQSRGYGEWAVDDDDPHQYEANSAEVDAEVRPGALFVKVENGIAIAVDHNHGFVFWAPGAAGGITRYACSVADVACGANEVLRSKRATGPSGGLTTIASHAYAVNGTVAVDQAVTGGSDLLLLEYRRTASPVTLTVPKTVRIFNLRVNGIASGDTFYTSEVVADIGSRLGFDTSGVEATTLNALPYDLIDESWADGLDYMAMLDDWQWFVGADEGEGPVLTYGGWEQTWDVLLSHHANADLDAEELFNRVIVTYPQASGRPAEQTVDASPDPLAGTSMSIAGGTPNVWVEELSDVQPDGALATAMATTLLAHVSAPRFTGSIDVAAVANGSPFDIRPGHLVRVGDWGPAEAQTLRIFEVEATPTSVRLGIDGPASVSGIIARDALADARRPWQARPSNRRGKAQKRRPRP